MGHKVADSGGLAGGPVAAWPDVDLGYTLPNGSSHSMVLEPMDPDPSTGYRVAEDVDGPVIVTIDRGADSENTSHLRYDEDYNGAWYEGSWPERDVVALSGNEWEKFTTGITADYAASNVTYDFTDLPLGYLPAGQLITTMDVDVPGEGIEMSSSASGEWLEYELLYQYSSRQQLPGDVGPYKVYEDSTYAQVPQQPLVKINARCVFRTTQDLTSLTFSLANGRTGWVYGSLSLGTEPLPTFDIVKDDGVEAVAAGEQTTYEVTVTNTSSSHASDILVSDTLPAELEFVSASDGGSWDSSSGTVSWTLPELAAGESRTVTITAKVKDTVSAGTEIVNVARVEAPGCGEECESTDTDNVTDPGATADADADGGDNGTSNGDADSGGNEKPKNNLADTGASGVLIVGSIATLLALAGAGIMIARRKKT